MSLDAKYNDLLLIKSQLKNLLESNGVDTAVLNFYDYPIHIADILSTSGDSVYVGLTDIAEKLLTIDSIKKSINIILVNKGIDTSNIPFTEYRNYIVSILAETSSYTYIFNGSLEPYGKGVGLTGLGTDPRPVKLFTGGGIKFNGDARIEYAAQLDRNLSYTILVGLDTTDISKNTYQTFFGVREADSSRSLELTHTGAGRLLFRFETTDIDLGVHNYGFHHYAIKIIGSGTPLKTVVVYEDGVIIGQSTSTINMNSMYKSIFLGCTSRANVMNSPTTAEMYYAHFIGAELSEAEIAQAKENCSSVMYKTAGLNVSDIPSLSSTVISSLESNAKALFSYVFTEPTGSDTYELTTSSVKPIRNYVDDLTHREPIYGNEFGYQRALFSLDPDGLILDKVSFDINSASFSEAIQEFELEHGLVFSEQDAILGLREVLYEF